MINPLEHLERRLKPLLADLPESATGAMTLQPPKDSSFGDLSIPCFPLAKSRKQPPPEVAVERPS